MRPYQTKGGLPWVGGWDREHPVVAEGSKDRQSVLPASSPPLTAKSPPSSCIWRGQDSPASASLCSHDMRSLPKGKNVRHTHGNPTVLWKDDRAVGEENQGLLKTREDLCCGQLAVMGFPACRPAPSLAGHTVGRVWEERSRHIPR